MWTVDTEAELISLIEEKRIIWSLRHPQHKNSKLVDKKWNEIANNLGRSIKDVKHKWTGLVKIMKKELKEIPKPKSGQAAKDYKSTFPHFQRMRFLISDIEYKKSTGNLTNFIFHSEQLNTESQVFKANHSNLNSKLDPEKISAVCENDILKNDAPNIENEERLYYSTLLTDLNTINRADRLRLRDDIISAVKNIVYNKSNEQNDNEDCVIIDVKIPNANKSIQ